MGCPASSCYHPRRGPVMLVGLIVASLLLVVWVQTRRSSQGLPPSFLSESVTADASTSRFQLQVRATSESDTFTILQIADIHLGEAEAQDWGPEQDRKTFVALDAIIGAEHPDLIVLSGDQLTAGGVDANATAYYEILASRLENYSIPYAMIFGNHDDEPWHNATHWLTTKTSRRQLLRSLQQFHFSLSMAGPASVTGVSNYWLDIYREDDVAARIALFDSGGGNSTEQIDESQIAWFHQTNDRMDLPIIAFAHIPISLAAFGYDQSRCQGLVEDGVAPLEYDAGLLNALSSTPGQVQFLAVGHNHGNDYCCALEDNNAPHVCFGRHSGYGGYGSWDRGGRVYQLEWSKESDSSMHWKSWVRLESGEVLDEYIPGQNG